MDVEREVPGPEEPLTGVSNFANRIGARNLLIIIVTMPLVFLIVVMAVIAIAGSPGGEDETAAAAADLVRSAPAGAAERLEQPPVEALAVTPASLFTESAAPLVLPEGAEVGQMTLDGDRLALRIDAANGGEIVVYDIARGAVIQRIRVTNEDEDGGL